VNRNLEPSASSLFLSFFVSPSLLFSPFDIREKASSASRKPVMETFSSFVSEFPSFFSFFLYVRWRRGGGVP